MDTKAHSLTLLSQAKAKLLVDFPYFGMIASRMELLQSDTTESFLSNGDKYQYNDEYISELELDEVSFTLANGAMHAVLTHESRKNSRMSWLWQLATDYAINDMLVENEMSKPYKCNYDERFEGMYAEEIYAILKDEIQNEEFDDNEDNETGYNEQDKQKQNELSEPNQDEAKEKNRPQMEVEDVEQSVSDEFFENIEQEAQSKSQSMGDLPLGLERFVEIVTSSKVDWREELRHAIDNYYLSDYRMMPPSKKLLYSGIYLPSLHSDFFRLTIAIDSSGSINEEQLALFMAEIESIMITIDRFQIDILVCDAKVHSHETFYAGDVLSYTIKGSGGTDFRPVFEYIEAHLYDTQLLLYFTDLEGQFPEIEPLYETIWVVDTTNKSQEEFGTPFGRCLVLNS
jgi:predicted metal-dependent peptidase